jgi:hypothetical protein
MLVQAALARRARQNPTSVRFFSFYHNFHQPVAYYIDGKKFTNDHNLEEYSP